MDDKIDVSVVVPTYNRAADVAELLGCLALQRLKPGVSWEVIVVDNASTDSTQDLLGRWREQLPLRVEYEPIRSSSAARNRGIRVARGRLIVFADSDVLVKPSWLQSFTDAAERHAEFTYFGGLPLPRYSAPGPPDWYEGIGQCTRGPRSIGNDARPSTQLWGGNWACRAEALWSVGLFEMGIGPADLPHKDRRIVGNEAHLMDKLAAAGYRGLLLPHAEVAAEHKVSPKETRLAYVVRWYFGLGRGDAFRAITPCTQVCGLPRWPIRRALEDGAKLLWALLCWNRLKAIRLLMQVATSAGYLYQSVRHGTGAQANPMS